MWNELESLETDLRFWTTMTESLAILINDPTFQETEETRIAYIEAQEERMITHERIDDLTGQ